MAWSAGVTRSTGDLVTAAQWNNYLGASGSLDYLKTEADKHDDCSVASPSRALDTIYQNGSKTRVVAVTISNSGAGEGVYIEIGSSSPPTTDVLRMTTAAAGIERDAVVFVVPANWYYRIATYAGSPTILYTTEWDLL